MSQIIKLKSINNKNIIKKFKNKIKFLKFDNLNINYKSNKIKKLY